MKKQGIKIFAPGSIATLVIGVIALVVVAYPFTSFALGEYGLYVLFFIVPVASVALGLLAMLYYFRARRYLKKRSLARGVGFARIGLFASIIALLGGSMISGAFTYIYFTSKGLPNTPIGNTQLYFYGDREHSETTTNTLLLPDNNLLTIGTRTKGNNLPKKRDMVLLKTSPDGEQIWYKVFPGTGSAKGTVANDNSIYICSATDRLIKNNADHPVIWLLKINIDGDSLDSWNLDLRGESQVADIISITDGSLLLLANVIMGDSLLNTAVLTKLDQNGDTRWIREYPSEPDVHYNIVNQTADLGYIVTGYKYFKENLKKTIMMFKVDSTGAILWQNPNKDITGTILDMVDLENGDWLAIGYQRREKQGFDGRILRFNADGKLLWNKSIDYESSLYLTGLIPWVDKNFLVIGNLPIDNKFRFERFKSWDTYFIAIVTTDGDVVHSFNGEKEVFQPWGITPISVGHCVMTGFGGVFEDGKSKTIANQDIGLLYYRADTKHL